jgi:hypothetical protein
MSRTYTVVAHGSELCKINCKKRSWPGEIQSDRIGCKFRNPIVDYSLKIRAGLRIERAKNSSYPSRRGAYYCLKPRWIKLDRNSMSNFMRYNREVR